MVWRFLWIYTITICDRRPESVALGANIAADQLFTYDAYGQMLPRFTGTSEVAINPRTTLLYSGEQTDASTGLQYLRARYYSPATGRFTQMDAFAGIENYPQSLHKYLYAEASPIQNTDPSGMVSLAALSIGINTFSAALNLTLAAIAMDERDYMTAAYHQVFASMDLAAIAIEMMSGMNGPPGFAYAMASAGKFSLVAAERAAALQGAITTLGTLGFGVLSTIGAFAPAGGRAVGLMSDTFLASAVDLRLDLIPR